MAPRVRISECWHDHGRAGVKLEITYHDDGAGAVYRAQISGGEQLAWVGTEEDAKAAAQRWLSEQGHVECSARCVTWTPIPQPQPLSELEKKNVVACFSALKEAVMSGGPYQHPLHSLQREYRGDARALVDGFDAASDKQRALQQLERELREEIESYLWQE